VRGDDALYQGRAGTRLTDHEDGGRVVVPGPAVAQPVIGQRGGEGVVHGLLRGLVEIQGPAPGPGPRREGIESRLPVLEVLELLAHAVVQEGLRPGVLVFRDEPRELIDVLAVPGTAQARYEPVGIGVSRGRPQHAPQQLLRIIQLVEEHVVVGTVDQVRDVFRAFLQRAVHPGGGAALVAEQAVYGAYEIEHHRVVIVELDGLRQGRVGASRLPGLHEQAREIRPGGPVLGCQGGDGAEGTYRVSGLLQFQGDQADEEVTLREIRFGAQQPLAACRGLVDTPGAEVGEALAQRVPHPRLDR
jgi:hypothetical protein